MIGSPEANKTRQCVPRICNPGITSNWGSFMHVRSVYREFSHGGILDLKTFPAGICCEYYIRGGLPSSWLPCFPRVSYSETKVCSCGNLS